MGLGKGTVCVKFLFFKFSLLFSLLSYPTLCSAYGRVTGPIFPII